MSTTKERLAAKKRRHITKTALDTVDDRFASSKFLQSAMDKIFPDHWSFMVGEIAMYCFIILVITGVYIALFYVPSASEVVYHGSYAPLRGQHMSEAYQSVLNLSFNVRGGLVMRQIHHWAALVFMAAVVFHMCRIFFTGAFRRPREINWIIGFSLLMISVLEGFSGYSLPDDLLSGSGLRVVFSIILAIPLIGTWVAFDLIGSQWPGTDLLNRLFVIHEFIFPLLIAGLLGAHLAIIWRQKHTDFPGPGKTETNIRGSRLWPQYAIKGGAMMLLIFGVLGALGGLFQVNPIWLYGPYNPYSVSEGSQPDIYAGWLDGMVRLWPHWEFRSWGHEIANPFFPGVLVAGLLTTIAFAWPWIDKRMYNDYGPHNLLDRPRDKPGRTAVGAAALAFIFVATFASADDLLAANFHVPFERMLEILQYGVIVGPVLSAAIAYKVCKALQRTDAHPIMKPVGGIIVRHANGSFHTLGAEHHGGEAGNGHTGNGHAGNDADQVGATNGHGRDGHRVDGRTGDGPTTDGRTGDGKAGAGSTILGNGGTGNELEEPVTGGPADGGKPSAPGEGV
ncbi:MAG: cytochrome bc complex cytochrome b subunit [Actinomycetota bacterium]|nr:cytochrome bc complex cytochrome b subunit [Actinomycetota bacterium]